MKTEDCIIQLSFVPERIFQATNGDIAEDMFLMRSAIESLLEGNMFSELDCRWTIAEQFTEEEADNVIRQLNLHGMCARLITLR